VNEREHEFSEITAGGWLAIALYLGAVDLPFSLIGDTLTLPWTIGPTVARLRGLPITTTPAEDGADATRSASAPPTE